MADQAGPLAQAAGHSQVSREEPPASPGQLVVRNTFIHWEEQEEDRPPQLFRTSSAPALLPPEGASRDLAPEGKAQQDISEADTAASEGDDVLGEGDDVLGEAEGSLGLEAPGGEPADTAASEGEEVLSEAPSGEPPSSLVAEWRTTMLFRNVPFLLTRDMLVELLDSQGFRGEFDLVYLPMDFKTNQTLGYGFVNAVNADAAIRFFRVFEGFHAWPVKSSKVCNVCWSDRQGLESNVGAYRNLTLMKVDMPEVWKPALFSRGRQVPFPAPTRRIKRYWAERWSAGAAGGAAGGAAVQPRARRGKQVQRARGKA